MKKTKLLIIQFVLLAVVGVLVILYLRSETKPVTVYQYTRTIEYNAEEDYMITKDDVREVRIPKDSVTANFVTNMADLQGPLVEVEDKDGKVTQKNSGMFIKNTVYAGEYVMKDHLTAEGEVVDPIEELGTDYRLITLPISMSTSLAGELSGGDYIDLLYTGSGSTQNEETGEAYSFKYTKLFMQNVLIYKIYQNDGTEFIPLSKQAEEIERQNLTLGSESNINGESGPVAGNPAYMTLAVSVSQAEEIYARLQVGSITYVGHLEQSEEVQPLGYVVGEYSKIFLGQGNAETNGLYVDSDIEGAVVTDINKEANKSN